MQEEYAVENSDDDDDDAGRLTIDEGSHGSDEAEVNAAAAAAMAAAAAAASQARLAELQIPEKQIKALTQNKPPMSFLGLEPLPQR